MWEHFNYNTEQTKISETFSADGFHMADCPFHKTFFSRKPKVWAELLSMLRIYENGIADLGF